MKSRANRLRSRFSYANVMATFAVFMVLGGSAYAAGAIITSSSQIGAHVIAGRNVKRGTLKLANLTPGARLALKGPQGEPGTPGAPGAPGASVFDAAIPAGTTISGAWGGRYIAPQLAFNNSYLLSTSFPVKAPVSLTDAEVNVAPNASAGDPDPSCTGSVDNPTAPAGKVCIYIGSSDNATVTGFKLVSPGTSGTQPGDAYGFIVRILDKGTVGNAATTAAEGTWAYTAP
jgi:hypothetical protein